MKNTKKKTIIFGGIVTILIAFFFGILLYKGNNQSILLLSSRIKELLMGSGAGDVREQYNFNYGWRFAKGEGKNNAGSIDKPVTNYINIVTPTDDSLEMLTPYSLNYDESTVLENDGVWKSVSLPHTYNDIDTFESFQENNQKFGERSLYSGTAWYKKSFFVPQSTGKRVIIEFEAARQAAKVYVNGVLQEGTYQNGFIAFGYDITDDIIFGSNNIITVMVDNSFPYKIEGTTSAVPWHDSHWHPNYGGLYRNSYLYIVDDLHLTLPLYSFTEGEGTYVYTTNESANTVKVHIDAQIENSGLNDRTFTYKALIKDKSGQTVLTMNGQSVTLSAGQKQTYQMEDTLSNPIRWSDDYPYMYTAIVQILENDVVIDSNQNNFGVRTFRITNDYGFYLNENFTELNGWGQKTTSEWAGLGAAFPNWMQDYIIKMMKDANSNFLRWGHVSGSQTQTNITDKYGLMVMMPGVDSEGASEGSVYDSNSYKLRIEAMRDMIISMRNHPSIIMWEIGNQSSGLINAVNDTYISNFPWLDYSNNVQAKYTSNTYGSLLNAVINQYDYGNRENSDNSGSYNATLSSSNRLISIRQGGASNKIAEYVDVGETTQGLQSLNNTTFNNKPAIEGEYNRLEIRRGVWDKITPGFETFSNTVVTGMSVTDTNNYSNVTNESNAIAEIQWNSTIRSATSYVGGANWIFSDSNSHGRVTSEVARATGEVDATMLPKVSYYVDRALFSSDPEVLIIGHWNYPVGTVKDVHVVGNNVSTVELKLNGISLGSVTLRDSNSNIVTKGSKYSFEDVAWQAGTLTAYGYDAEGNTIATNSITTHGNPTQIKITPIISSNGLKANGSDVALFDIELLDANNNRCISYDGGVTNQNITFTYTLSDSEGPTGTWIGGYNSATPENTRSDTLYFEAGITRVSVRTTENAGDITVTATMGALTDTETITSQSVTANQVYLGLSNYEDAIPEYVLDSSNNIGLGNGAKLGIVQEENLSQKNSLLIKDLVYNGTEHANNSLYDAFHVGIPAFSDSAYVITNIPYQYINAEYLRLPLSDRDSTNQSLITFSITRDIDIMVARDQSIALPSWMSSFVDTGQTLQLNNNSYLKIYKKSYTYDPDSDINNVVTLGSNSDNASLGASGCNQIIFLKETEKVTNRSFFNENFDDFDMHKLTYGFSRNDTLYPGHTFNFGFNSSEIDNSIPNVMDGTIAGSTGVRFYDNDSNISYILKEFAPMSEPFSVEMKLYVTSQKINQWIRLWLTYGAPKSQSDKEKLAVELYANRESDGTGNTFNLTTKEDNTQKSASTTLGSGYQLNKWYRIKCVVDPQNRTFSTYVYNDLTENWDLANGANNIALDKKFVTLSYRIDEDTWEPIHTIDHISIGTSKNSVNEFYIDDLIISPIMGIGADSITINGKLINLRENISSYLLVDTTSPHDSNITLQTNDEYFEHTITKYNDKITVNITNLVGDNYTFDVNFESAVIMNGISVVNPVGVQGVNVVPEILDNEEVIHITDTSSDNLIYIEKPFTAIDTALNFSYDIYIKDQSDDSNIIYNNEYIRSLLSNGVIGLNHDISLSNIVGVNSYIHSMTPNLESFQFVTQTQTISEDTPISLNAWHNIRYDVNVVTHTYDIYLDNTIIVDEAHIDFFNNDITQLSNLVIGTSTTGTEEFYIKNINVEEISKPAIDGITIDGYIVDSFDKDSNLVNYYTGDLLTNETTIEVVSNEFYVSHEVVKDLNNQTITINITDNISGIQTYTVTYADPLTRNVTKEQLLALITRANALSSSNYTFNTWAVLEDILQEAQGIYNDSNSLTVEIASVYFSLETAINDLLEFQPYDDSIVGNVTETNGAKTATVNYTRYATSLVDTIYYSSNLSTDEFMFNNVLENGAIVYNDGPDFTWQSVPYKYMNAEYLVIDNCIKDNSSFQFTALHDIDLLIFKDWDSGPLTDEQFSNTIMSVDPNNAPIEPTKVDTKEIAVATGTYNGNNKKVVYYVYKKSYNRGDIIQIDGEKLINNRITGNNSVIAFIKTGNSNNENFFYENIDTYSTFTASLPDSTNREYTGSHLFNKGWANFVSVTESGGTASSSVTEVRTDSNLNHNYIYQASDSAKSMPIVQKEFADLTESFQFKFKGYTELAKTGNTTVENKWLRAWITNFDNEIEAITSGDPDKTRTLIDFYIGEKSMLFSSSSIIKNAPLGRTTLSTWYDYQIDFDNLSQTADIYLNGTKMTFPFVYNNNTVTNNYYNTGNNANRVANHVYFSGRGSNISKGRFREIYINPIPSNVYEDLAISTNGVTTPLGCGINSETCTTPTVYTRLYQDLTKSYLYKVSNATDAHILVSSNNVGSNYGNEIITNDIDMINYLYSTIDSGNVTINGNDYNRSHEVYYEVEENGAKNALVNLVNIAMKKAPRLYTDDSWAQFINELNNSKEVLADHKSTQQNVETQTANLQTAINNLVLINNINYEYVGKSTFGKVYDDFENTDVNITNNSSITANFSLTTRTATSTYIYATNTHTRYLVVDNPLPEKTKITLIDKSGINDIYYTYYVKNTDSSKLEYPLNDFVRVGTSDLFYSNNYNFDSETRILHEEFSIILDFENTVNNISNGTHELSMELNIDSSKISNSDVLSYDIYSNSLPVSFNVNVGQEYYYPGDQISLSLETSVGSIVSNDITIIDTTLGDKLLGIKMSLYLDINCTTQIPFGSGTIASDGENVYNVDDDGTIRISRGIDIQSFDRNYLVNSLLSNFNPGIYYLKVDLLSSYDGLNNGEIISTDISKVEIVDNPNCSINVDVINGTNVIMKSKSRELDVVVNTICNNSMGPQDITISLYKKNNSIFNDFNYTLIDYLENVDNSIATLFDTNIYKLSSRINVNQTRTEYVDNYNIDFKNSIEVGTYELVFDIRVGDIIQTDRVHFVIK